jgi:methionine synthase II (cobalamin-independent)
VNGFTASGIGSWPGTHSDEAARVIAGELPELPHIAELPERGPGADMIGRTMALLADISPDFAVETTPTGWRMADRPGRIMRRATAWWGEDLDSAEAHFRGAPRVKTQVCGPWTLAAAIESRGGERIIRDHGACREIAEALGAAVEAHVRQLQRRLPGAQVVVQIDEPSLPAALAGQVATASGLATYRRIDPQIAQSALARISDVIAACDAQSWVHCCAADVPIPLLLSAGFHGVSIDPLQGGDSGARTREGIPLIWDAGRIVAMGILGVTPGPGPDEARAEHAAHLVEKLLHRWGFPTEDVAARTVLTPSCGLAGSSPDDARRSYAVLREVGRLLRDEAPAALVEEPA